LLFGKFPSLRNSKYRRSSSPWNTLLQIGIEFRRSNPSSPPAVFYHHARANCSAGNPPPRRNPGLKCTRTEVIFKKFDGKMNFKFKENVQRELQIYPITPSAAFPNFVRLSL
jgi:hypothetical protein